MNFDLKDYLKEKKEYFEKRLHNFIIEKSSDPNVLSESMHYSLFADGKRIRPILVLATAEALEIPVDDVIPIAASLEMIHVFSLIHDDLPAMDDDDLRRGQPTNHKVYGDAIAILAGDALLAEAFVPLCQLDSQKYSAEKILQVILHLAKATGHAGMIGGQVIDIESEGKKIKLERLKTLHRKKTGALIKASVMAPAILAGVSDEKQRLLADYAESIGLAFQIADDILDIEGGEELGKDIGSDIEKGKSTYPALLGLEGAKSEAARTLEQALLALNSFDEKADPLRVLARYIVERKK